MSDVNRKLTTEFTVLPDETGEQILSDMELDGKIWQDVIKDRAVPVVDFANWLQIDEQRQARFAAIRAKSPVGVWYDRHH